MQKIPTSLMVCALFCGLALPRASADVVTFTNDTLVSFADTNFDGAAIVISNCTVKIDGVHTFESVSVQNGGKLTHTYAPNGLVENLLSVLPEQHTFSPTNTVLPYTNVVTQSILVKDLTGATNYIPGIDYQVGYLATGETELVCDLPAALLHKSG